MLNNPLAFNGMQVQDIQLEPNKKFNSKEIFLVDTPIFIREYDSNGKAIHLTFRDENAGNRLTEVMNSKLKIAGLDHRVEISFDKSYTHPKTKLVDINGIKSKTSFCPIIIEGDPEAICFAWNVGVGHSTGCGFGALK